MKKQLTIFLFLMAVGGFLVVQTQSVGMKPLSNPWRYDFAFGQVITDPPALFCRYFKCTPHFWKTSGYVIECHDERFSRSSEAPVPCASDGGAWRVLYQHTVKYQRQHLAAQEDF